MSKFERQNAHKLKVLKTDGGGEYVSKDFERFCGQEGIIHEAIPPHEPWQNGVVEIKNQSIMNMVRNILKWKNLPKESWGEAASMTSYLLNMCPTNNIEKIAPEEARYGFKSNLNHLRVFGFVMYQHVLWKLRKKSDDKG